MSSFYHCRIGNHIDCKGSAVPDPRHDPEVCGCRCHE